ncbi:MAG: esterase-like activity of phytase family protein [Polymorphobacter sp.]
MLIERILSAGVLLTAATLAVMALQPETANAVPAPAALTLTVTPLPLDRDDPARAEVGALRFLGAVQMRSTNPLFGGISGLRAGPGGRMLAVTDTGNWLAFTTTERGDRLVGVADAVLAAIPTPDGQPITSKAQGDAEALEWDAGTGGATIVYEQQHRMVQFSGIDAARPATLARQPDRTEFLTAMAGWPENGGGEAMAVLPGGTRVIIAEHARRSDGSAPLLLTRSGTTTEHGLALIPGFSPTDAIAIDDTRILVLQRRFSPLGGWAAALALVDLAPMLGPSPPATPLPQRELARLQAPLTFDNMEGLAIRHSGDRLFVYLVSDDNLNSLQRTLLMKFELQL